MDVALIHRDEALVVANKPSGLAVHRGWAKDDAYLMTIVRDLVGAWVFPIHRLDRATSGVVLFGLTPEDAEAVQAQIRARAVDKRYLALVRGVMPEGPTVIDRPLATDKGGEPKPARTDVTRLWVFRRRYSLVEARPHTGRQHQVRRHLRGLSHPIIGDVRYGRGEENRAFRAEFGLERLALHAREVRCAHPRTGAPLTLSAPLPPDLAGPLAAMGCPLADL
ncbi:MAG: pseudouridylate synthase [Myxococcales bacterium]|nr:pseudouridylate synthase [Myxococcales bacterium]MCB9731723.1 pseudouridylate synthase [Deltaproteobacteria bacterium]